MPQTPLVSVVIPSWNGEQRITSTLESLDGQTLAPERFEIIVVDDGSDDATALVVDRFAARHPALQVRCLRQSNGGVNAARNVGVQASRGMAVALLDDDERAPADHLERAVGLLDAHAEVAGVGGPARDTGGDHRRTCAGCSIADVVLPHEGQVITDRLLGGNMVVRRSVFDEVGPFDEDISGRGDETEWFYRARLKFLYDDSLFIWHDKDGLSLRRLAAIQFRQGRAIPIAARKMRGTSSYRPHPDRVPRYLVHGLRKRCDKGYLLAMRELGALYEHIRLRRRERTVPARAKPTR
ncbi:MAG: glycosyltransferase family 2 protein [Actinobacteria bacterium]|nr:glycosyltransferase family 2 protein [Actinomycetota bacterium]